MNKTLNLKTYMKQFIKFFSNEDLQELMDVCYEITSVRY